MLLVAPRTRQLLLRPLPAQASPPKVEVEAVAAASTQTDELGDELTSFEAITNFNNFFEFTTDKEDVAALAQDFDPEPWKVEVGGLVNNPKTYDIDDLRTKFDQQERIYRLRCVEGLVDGHSLDGLSPGRDIKGG